jgi:hypothetical protein
VQPVEFERKLFRFGFRGWLTNSFFQQHAEILLWNLKIENRIPVCQPPRMGVESI